MANWHTEQHDLAFGVEGVDRVAGEVKSGYEDTVDQWIQDAIDGTCSEETLAVLQSHMDLQLNTQWTGTPCSDDETYAALIKDQAGRPTPWQKGIKIFPPVDTCPA